MTCISISYIMQAPEGFKLEPIVSNMAGVAVSILFLIIFFVKMSKLTVLSKSEVNLK